MLASVLLQLMVHLGFFLLAAVAGFVGVFYVGVPAYGDNPGALFGGLAVFWLSYMLLVGVEGAFRAWRWAGSPGPRVVGFYLALAGGGILYVAVALLAQVAAGFTVGGGSAVTWLEGDAWPMNRIAVSFFVAETLLHYGVRFLLDRRQRPVTLLD